jgi:hypothetical protein
VLQVAKRATWRKAIEDFAIERTLPRMREMVDREAGDHRVERHIERWQRRIKIVAYDPGERIGPLDHSLGKVERHAVDMRIDETHQR